MLAIMPPNERIRDTLILSLAAASEMRSSGNTFNLNGKIAINISQNATLQIIKWFMHPGERRSVLCWYKTNMYLAYYGLCSVV